jgi:hypothetical protein
MDPIKLFLTDLLIYLANGALVTIYFLGEHAAQLAAGVVAITLAATVDRLVQYQSVYAPQRYGAGAVRPSHVPRTAQAMTGVAFSLWLAATWSFQSVVPVIGAVMWAGSLLGLLIMPQQRWSLLWTTKAYLILYSLAVIGFRIYLWHATQLPPEQLARVLGGSASASAILAQNIGAVASVGTWVLWVIMPAGFFGLLLQNWLAQPMALIGPLQGAQDVLATLRTRGNEEGMAI